MKGYLVLEITNIMCITEFLRVHETQQPIKIATIKFNTILFLNYSYTAMAPVGSRLFKFQIKKWFHSFIAFDLIHQSGCILL